MSIGLALLTGLATSMQAVAASSLNQRGNYCITAIKRDGTIVHNVCADTEIKAVEAKRAMTQSANAGALVPVDLITFFQHSFHEGNWQTIVGYDGPCDVLGYGMSDLTIVNSQIGGISSYTYHNWCSAGHLWYWTSYIGDCGFLYGSPNYVGALCNDHLLSMKVWRHYA